MKKKDLVEKLTLYFLLIVIFVFTGYFWRMHHEVKQAELKYRRHINQFLHEVFSPDTAMVSHYNGYTFVKRQDGSVVIKRR